MINTRKILLGLSLLGATTLVGFSAPAQAKDGRKDVKEARKDVKKARRDVRNANTPEERRDAREDLRGEKRDLREERRENGYRPGYKGRNDGRPGYGYSRPGYGYGRPNTNPSGYVRPGYQNQNIRVWEGTVLNDLSGNDFTLRTNGGQVVRVVAVRGESGRISRGDKVRVTGTYSGSTFRANSVSILKNR